METKIMKLANINPAPYNPRKPLKPGDTEYEALAKSLDRFGLVEPLIVNATTGTLIGGHQRLNVLKAKGETEAEVVIVEVSEENEKLLNIALNKIEGDWDFDKLEAILRDFDYEVATASGFAAEEIAVILANNDDLNDDYGEYDDEWDDGNDEETIVGGSYVITLIFDNPDFATEWAEKRGYKGQVKDGASTTVIRIEGHESEDDGNE